MANRRITLNYPPDVVQEPVTYYLVKDYDLKINILKARILPREGGRLIMELSGSKDRLDAAMAYLAGMGIEVKPIVREIRLDPDKCLSCSACTAICPTQALAVNPETWEVDLDHDKCVLCESCVAVCPYRAIDIYF